MENEGAERGKMNVPLLLKPGGTYGLLCFSEIETRKGAEGKPLEVFTMKYTVLEGRDEVGKAKMTVFSLARSDTIGVIIKGSSHQIAQKRPLEVNIRKGEMVTFTGTDGSEIGKVEIISPFHYVVFLDDKAPDGKLRLTFYEHRSYNGAPLETMDNPEEETKKEGQ